MPGFPGISLLIAAALGLRGEGCAGGGDHVSLG